MAAVRPWLSVVVPAYNEEARLPATLAAVLSHLRGLGRPFEVVVADDGAVDATARVAEAAGPEVTVVRMAHAGKGAAVRAGVLATRGELVLVTDADQSTPVAELARLEAAIEGGADLAIGSRRLRSSRVEVRQPLARRLMGAVFSRLVRHLVLGDVSDSQCGFKLFRGDLARDIFAVSRIDGFAYDVEAILLVRQRGGRVAEVPVEWRDASRSRVHAVRDPLAMLIELLRIRRWKQPDRPRRPRLGEPGAVLLLAAALYLAAGVVYALGEHMVAGDAYSRVAIAHRILFSRDPHMAAIGFVWSPLPIVALLPLVPLKWLVPVVTDQGFVADVVSALCMAGAAREVCLFLRDMGVGRARRLALAATFALHPLIVLYAANGMSEAMFLLLLLAAARRLAAWLRTDDVTFAVGAGLALAAAYLTRYESLVAWAAVVALAVAAGWWRRPGTRRQRRDRAVADAVVIGLPLAVAFVAWVIASWVITGDPMEQFASSYGNTAQLSVKVGWSPGPGGWSRYAAEQLLIVEPFVIAVVGLGALRALALGRGAAMLAVMGVVGGVLAFMVWSNARGVIDHELRYMIVAVPLTVLMAGAAMASPARRRPASRRPGPVARVAGFAGGTAALLMVVAALPVAAVELTSMQLNPGDAPQVHAMFDRRGVAEQRAAARFQTERQMAADIDALRLPPDSVLVDDFLGFAVPLSSRDPGQFVITSDRDFQSVLADPAGSRIRYVLVPEPVEQGKLDAVNRRYPSLYANGAGMATLVRQYTSTADRVSWRLYRLDGTPAG